jgi:hypothetical protein
MADQIIKSPPRHDSADGSCLEIGRLICRDSCYALEGLDGVAVWLEMDRIPMNLIEQQVSVEGQRYGLNLIAVRSIGPVLIGNG